MLDILVKVVVDKLLGPRKPSVRLLFQLRVDALHRRRVAVLRVSQPGVAEQQPPTSAEVVPARGLVGGTGDHHADDLAAIAGTEQHPTTGSDRQVGQEVVTVLLGAMDADQLMDLHEVGQHRP